MPATPETSLSRFGLACRHYWLVIVVVSAIGLLLAAWTVLRSGDDNQYEASALVIATQLEIRPEILPRVATEIFESGAVARAATSGPDALPVEASELIPDRVRLKAFENSIILALTAEDDDPAVAVMIANRVAESFAAELNALGPGVGQFRIQNQASSADEVTTGATGMSTLAMLVVAVGLADVAVIGLLLALRRPILSSHDAARAAGRPVLGTLTIPKSKRSAPRGVGALARVLFPAGQGLVGLLAGPAGGSVRERTAILLANHLSAIGPITLVTGMDKERLADRVSDGVTIVDDLPRPAWDAVGPVLVDDPGEPVITTIGRSGGGLVLLAVQGSHSAALEDLASDVGISEVIGVIVVRTPRRR